MAKNVAEPQLIRPLSGLSAGDRPAAGGKAASLGELAGAGLRVPAGFVVTAAAFERGMAALDPSGEIGRAIEGTFVLEDLHNIGPDYDPTLMAWWDNFDRTYSEITSRYDRKFYLMWKFYLLAAAGASRSRDGQLFQFVLTKTGREQPDCRIS